VQVAQVLYDQDILSEEGLFQWEGEKRFADETDKKYLNQCNAFLTVSSWRAVSLLYMICSSLVVLFIKTALNCPCAVLTPKQYCGPRCMMRFGGSSPVRRIFALQCALMCAPIDL
jgi:hypothetical protein